MSAVSLHFLPPAVVMEQAAITPAVVSPLEGIQWVKRCLEQHPEIEWLGSDEVRATQEGAAKESEPYSVQI